MGTVTLLFFKALIRRKDIRWGVYLYYYATVQVPDIYSTPLPLKNKVTVRTNDLRWGVYLYYYATVQVPDIYSTPYPPTDPNPNPNRTETLTVTTARTTL